MKIFHDHDENDTWTEITTIAEYPSITSRLDETNQISFVLNDFEGGLYTTWEGYNFIPIKVEDDATNILFRGFLTGKKFTHNKLMCTCHGLSVKLDWTPLHKNYVLAQGLVKTIPSVAAFPGAVQWVYPDADGGNNNWGSTEANHWESVLTYDDAEYIQAGDGDEGTIEEFEFGNPAGITECTSVKVYLYGKYSTTAKTITVDLYNGVGWEGPQNINFGATLGWQSHTFAGLAMTQAHCNALEIRITANADYGAGDATRITGTKLYLTYSGTSPNAMDVTDADGDAFTTWAADQWHQNIDAGLLIRDTSENWSSKAYVATVVAAANETSTAGNVASCNTKNDDDYFEIVDQGADPNHLDATGTVTLGGDNIDSTTQKLKEIKITYNIGILRQGNVIDSMKEAIFEIKYNETTWIEIFKQSSIHGEAVVKWIEGTHIITGSDTELAKYMSKTGDNYDEIENIRVRLNSYGDYPGANDSKIQVEYLKADIYYYESDIAPIQESIDDSGLSWLFSTGVDFAAEGVNGESVADAADGDSFVIGATTTNILEETFGLAGVGLSIKSTLSKYIGQHFKGTFCKEVLKKICLIEGLHWWEDHILNQVVVSKEANFVDSTEDLTEANYDYGWEFEDDNNYYSAVEIYGSAGYNIYYKTPVDATIDSPRTKTIIEETIMTQPEAKDIGDAILLEYKTKRPSIKISLIGVNTNLQVGTTVGLTMVRPTVGAADYPIRMIERTRHGASIKTVIYCGLGHSTDQEKIADVINKIAYLSHKAHTDRLISTNFAPGATFTWSDIGGAEAAVEAIITAEIVAGQSIDNAIDALIADTYTNAEINTEDDNHQTAAEATAAAALAAHHNGITNEHDGIYYTEAEVDAAIDADILTHKNLTNDHHVPTVKYTNAEAVAAVNAAGTSLAATKVHSSADGDTKHLLGRAAVGYNSSHGDAAVFAHRDMMNGTDYALKQDELGNTALNAKATKGIYFDVNSAQIGYHNVTTLDMGARTITNVGLIDGVDISGIDTKAPLIYPFFTFGGGGFANSSGYGACLLVVFSDVNAKIDLSFWVHDGGDFKIRFIHGGTGANAGKTIGGIYYISYDVDGGTQTWDAGPIDINLPAANAQIVGVDDSAAQYTIADNSKVGVYYAKDDNAGGAAGNMHMYGIVLVRQ